MGFATFSRDGSKGLPRVLLQAVEQKEAFFAVFGGQPGKGSAPVLGFGMGWLEHQLGTALNLWAIPIRRSLTFSAAVISLTLLLPSTLVGWGHEGHEIVASLAQTRLTEKRKTRDSLPDRRCDPPFDHRWMKGYFQISDQLSNLRGRCQRCGDVCPARPRCCATRSALAIRRCGL